MRRGFACVLLTVAALCLPACTDDPPTPPPTTTSSPSQTTTAPPTTQPPPSPPPANRTPAGAEAFVRYFWQTYNYAYATLNPSPLTSISESECKFCASAAHDVDRLRQQGTRVSGTEVVVTAAVAPPDKITTGIIVTTVVRQEAGSSVTGDETKPIEAVPNRRSYIGLHWRSGTWTVNGVTIEKQQ